MEKDRINAINGAQEVPVRMMQYSSTDSSAAAYYIDIDHTGSSDTTPQQYDDKFREQLDLQTDQHENQLRGKVKKMQNDLNTIKEQNKLLISIKNNEQLLPYMLEQSDTLAERPGIKTGTLEVFSIVIEIVGHIHSTDSSLNKTGENELGRHIAYKKHNDMSRNIIRMIEQYLEVTSPENT